MHGKVDMQRIFPEPAPQPLLKFFRDASDNTAQHFAPPSHTRRWSAHLCSPHTRQHYMHPCSDARATVLPTFLGPMAPGGATSGP
jgi:hypothetical protein